MTTQASIKCSDSEVARRLSAINQHIYNELQQMQRQAKDSKEKESLSQAIRNIAEFRCSALKETWDEVYFLHTEDENWDIEKAEQEFSKSWIKKITKLSSVYEELEKKQVNARYSSVSKQTVVSSIESATNKKMVALLNKVLEESKMTIQEIYPEIE